MKTVLKVSTLALVIASSSAFADVQSKYNAPDDVASSWTHNAHQVDTNTMDISNIKTTLDAHGTQLEKMKWLESEIKADEDSSSIALKKATFNAAHIDAVEKKVDTNTAEISTLKDSVGKETSEIKQMHQDLADKYSHTEREVLAAASEAHDAKTKATANEGEINKLKDSSSQMEKMVQKHEDTFAAIGKIQTKDLETIKKESENIQKANKNAQIAMDRSAVANETSSKANANSELAIGVAKASYANTNQNRENIASNKANIAKNSKAIAEIRDSMEDMSKRIDGVEAMNMATGSLFQPYNVGKVNVSVGLGAYEDAHAIAIGAGVRMNEHFAVRTSVAYEDSSSRAAFGVGASYEW